MSIGLGVYKTLNKTSNLTMSNFQKSKQIIFSSLLTYNNKELFKDSINIHILKNKLEHLRKTYNQNELFQEEIKCSNIILKNLKQYPYSKDSKIDLSFNEILKTKKTFCVWYSILAHIFLEYLWINNKALNIPNHSAIEINIWKNKYYFDNLSFDEIIKFKYWKKINFLWNKWIYKEVILENNYSNNENKKIFWYSWKSEKILKSFILNDIWNKEKNIKQSINFYKKALKLDKNSPTIYANIWSYFFEKWKYKDAIKYYNKSLTLNPTNFAIHLNKWICYEKMLKIKKAIKSYKKSISLNNSSIQANLLLKNLQKQ